jgi:hypothetical protein
MTLSPCETRADHDPPTTATSPYYVKRTPRGSVVICGEHLITAEEVKHGEAMALARSLNMEHQTRMLL